MAKERRSSAKVQRFPFGRKNLYLLSIGLLVLIIGYIFMAQPPADSFWSMTLSPVVLLIAYLIIIPIAIFYGRKSDAGN